jgi:hypothetical protein
MSAKKNTKDLMAERNPLQRAFVEPVDIYEQETEGQQAASKSVTTQQRSMSAKKKAAKAADDPLRPYSTYLPRSHVKNIKRHAVEREVKDMVIMQEAVEEYLKRHPL